MPLATESKQEIIGKYRAHGKDTGSSEVQIALWSERIQQLAEHLQTHENDYGSRRGLLLMVSKRRRLLKYLRGHDAERYKTLIQKLGIRH